MTVVGSQLTLTAINRHLPPLCFFSLREFCAYSSSRVAREQMQITSLPSPNQPTINCRSTLCAGSAHIHLPFVLVRDAYRSTTARPSLAYRSCKARIALHIYLFYDILTIFLRYFYDFLTIFVRLSPSSPSIPTVEGIFLHFFAHFAR